MSIYPRRSGFKRVASISRKEQDGNRAARAAENLPIGFLEDGVVLASEDEIAIANINRKKDADNEKRKAKKALKVKAEVVNGAAAKSSVKAKRKKGSVAK